MASTRVWISFLMIVLLCTFTVTKVYGDDSLVNADDDEFEDEVESTPPTNGVPLFPEKKQQPSKTLQQADDLYDADEFEGIEHIKKQQMEQVVDEETPEPVEPKIMTKPKFGVIEMLYSTFIVMLLANYYVGKKANEKIATAWGSHFQSLFTNSFAKFGDAGRFIITKESANNFSVTVSGGRARCIGAVFTLDLNKRHDLTSYISGIINPHKDTMTVDVAMQPNQPFCFALGKKKEEKQLLKNYKDVAELGVPAKLPSRLANYVAYTDSQEIVDDVFTRDIIETLANNELYFSSVGYTDLSQTYVGQKTILRIVYRLPPANEMKQLADLMRIAFTLIDQFGTVSLTKSTVAKNEGIRKKVVKTQEKSTHEAMQEAAQKKKQDKLIAERAAYEKLSPEAQRKYEEKEEKRKLKAKQGKVKVVYS